MPEKKWRPSVVVVAVVAVPGGEPVVVAADVAAAARALQLELAVARPVLQLQLVLVAAAVVTVVVADVLLLTDGACLANSVDATARTTFVQTFAADYCHQQCH